MGETNGRNQWLLWLAGIVFSMILAGMTLLTNSVIANDRMRADEDNRIRDKVELGFKENQLSHSQIISKLSRIEALMDRGIK